MYRVEMSLDRIYSHIRDELAVVEERLVEVANSSNKTISAAVMDILKAGGKRLRPALVLLSAKACNQIENDKHTRNSTAISPCAASARNIELAVAVELMHTASLIHDDVIDNADMRRGIRTLNSRWGNKTSVLVGDHVYAKMISILAEDGDIEIMRAVAEAGSRMTESEVTQSLCRGDMDVSEEKYLAIIAGKTASLISCSCRVGAMLGEIRDGEVEVLGDYGLNLGMAFQITDDLLDVTGDERKLGKHLWSDVRGGSLTLPFIHTMSEAQRKDKGRMIGMLRNGEVSRAALAQMKKMVEDYGGIDYCIEKARHYGKACKKRLISLRESEARTSLALLADYVVDRVS